MCGIHGEIRFDEQAPDRAAQARVGEALAPRGPDAQGEWRRGATLLGHRRLKIIDLSDASAQPLEDAELGLTIVFNGAIYNYPELRRELEGQGYRFRSQGDTEVLLKAYHAWGEDFVQRLNGMFAFAIAEHASGALLLGRDRLGIKPLYYSRDARRLRFASTLPALLQGGPVDTALDPVALHHYLSWHAVVPPPHTMLAGVRKLEAASLLRIEADGSGESRRYWSLEYGPREGDAQCDFEEWRDRLGASLRSAVRRRLVADVPVGVLLSGGVDSSLVVGLLAEQGARDLATFSVGFDSVGDTEGNEFEYSDLIAQRFATRHQRIHVPEAALLEALDPTIAAMSEPMVSHDVVGFYLLSREVAKSIKVVQSGQGADEVFAGYHWYPPLVGAADPVAAYREAFFDRSDAQMRQLLRRGLPAQDASGDFVARHFGSPGAQDPVDRALRLDTQVMLVDDPVKRVDNMTMAWGLEARVPFLDHELVELAARMPAEIKLRDGGKGVLKALARQVVPAEVIDRPKGYFPVPALKHLREPLLGRIASALTDPGSHTGGLYDPRALDAMLSDPDAHITRLGGSELWQLGLLELWLRAQLP